MRFFFDNLTEITILMWHIHRILNLSVTCVPNSKSIRVSLPLWPRHRSIKSIAAPTSHNTWAHPSSQLGPPDNYITGHQCRLFSAENAYIFMYLQVLLKFLRLCLITGYRRSIEGLVKRFVFISSDINLSMFIVSIGKDRISCSQNKT